ncbi:hypothetical protein B9Q13_04365 [Candidatus Marsarchaeota G2 archaeon ECH_B_SAG-G16]|uniref:Uncharacterized protein n=5 Tax=Candidatus Marsarchaeota TaxID=1978152 RepID=A0A2R6AGR1_9ARCH|nr:MAG: hypothetical protein B9Q01_09685 [Candidatus Marsarchaeota G1 archaeon OSP_D]PSN85566.1 MAG: hypothetical protein B9Q02_05750 [Candidatus Marsarchaeota G1 archaeon BE_D]PSN86247.1 MAG: hypothetical protein B9Q00_10480 [Candidatus Marsarchaeota G1 archaeon OSP_C]PSN91201.1 MAG: hypothetical protein B9P99_04185 [Candidatus Marsarchaeota G1 archaeon OSP_B]PSO04552.1 MAG: hypothetical protein B9Q13_04365 [Candidatus Marsarchaeota G2 archaeon ECH_B_SAG-G16]
MVSQVRIKCKKCGELSDVTKYVVTPTYTFVAQLCGHRHFYDTAQLSKELEQLGLRDNVIKKEIEENLTRPRNYPIGEGKHEE